MTKILIPIPQTPLMDPRTFKVTREWYRYFSLLQQAVGDTEIIVNNEVLSFPAPSPIEPDPLTPYDLGGQQAGEIEALQTTAGALNPQVPGPVELGQALAVVARYIPFPMAPTESGPFVPDVPFAMPPTELGHLEAAKNTGYRIAAAGNVVLVAGTATVSSAYANTANEFELTAKIVGGTQGILSIGTITANTSFVVNSSDAADTSTVSWVIFAPVRG